MNKVHKKGTEVYPYLFSPIKIGHIVIPNRTFWPPWDFNWANKDGSVSEKLHNFYINLAKSGCGIIYTGAATVSSDSIRFEKTMGIYNKSHVKSNQKLCKEIIAHDSIPAIQLMNFGRQSVTTFTGKPILAPSNVPCKVTSICDPNYKIKEMTLEDIDRVKNDFINGAVLGAEAGYKIIQVHAAHGYLLSNFLSPYTNKRTDEYGGSIENRCRIVIDIIKGIRQKLGNSVLIDIRLSISDFVEGGLVPEDYATIIPLIEAAGIDMLNASGTIFESSLSFFMQKLQPEGRYIYLADIVKKYTSLPLGQAGYIGTLKKGDEFVKNKQLELVGYGRTQFADNEFIKNSVFNKKNNDCVWCGKCLLDLLDPQLNFEVHCTVNPNYLRPKNAMFSLKRFYQQGVMATKYTLNNLK